MEGGESRRLLRFLAPSAGDRTDAIVFVWGPSQDPEPLITGLPPNITDVTIYNLYSHTRRPVIVSRFETAEEEEEDKQNNKIHVNINTSQHHFDVSSKWSTYREEFLTRPLIFWYSDGYSPSEDFITANVSL
ncbi:hypothetical protein RUM44_003649 [Polyplax serrata]|uniref:Uncharacterized protein n=1 Tax=Polyplax serrata TaxID=468196 RepID=A0ABR1AHN2_POLSC